MKKTNKVDNQPLSTVEETLAKLTPKQRKKFDEEYKEFALSEMLLSIMEQDKTSVRKLAKVAGVSPSIIQAMRSGTKKDYSLTIFLKVLKGLGCKRFKVEYHGKYLDLPIQVDLPEQPTKRKKISRSK